MKPAQLIPYVGKIVVLDLVMGKEITTRIKSVNEVLGTVTCATPLLFVPVPDPRNPQNVNIMTFPYGSPLYDAGASMEIETAHVFTIFTPTAEHASAYQQKTSGLVTAPAGVLDQLPKFDPNAFR